MRALSAANLTERTGFLPAAASMRGDLIYVRYWHKADVQTALMNVRFEGNNGHGTDVTRCPLMTQSGHCGTRQEPEAVLCRVIPATQPSRVRNVALFETLGLHS
jgi:hypothetical protein